MSLPLATPISLSLHPLYLPYKTQYRLFIMVQDILEEYCFNFRYLWLLEVLKARSCEYVESMELTRGIRIVFRHYKDLPAISYN